MSFMRFTSLNQMSQLSDSLIRISRSTWMLLLYMNIIYREREILLYYINKHSMRLKFFSIRGN